MFLPMANHVKHISTEFCLILRQGMHDSLLLLQDIMALLAYEEPEKSPMFHLLGLEYRQHVADNLNRAILGLFPKLFLLCAIVIPKMLYKYVFSM